MIRFTFNVTLIIVYYVDRLYYNNIVGDCVCFEEFKLSSDWFAYTWLLFVLI